MSVLREIRAPAAARDYTAKEMSMSETYEVGELVQISGSADGPWGDAVVDRVSNDVASGLRDDGVRWCRGVGSNCIRKHPVRPAAVPPIAWKVGDECEVRLTPGWTQAVVSHTAISGEVHAVTESGEYGFDPAEVKVLLRHRRALDEYATQLAKREVASVAAEAWNDIGGTAAWRRSATSEPVEIKVRVDPAAVQRSPALVAAMFDDDRPPARSDGFAPAAIEQIKAMLTAKRKP